MAKDGPEKIFVEAITAMQEKDGSRLKELSHPEFSGDSKQFDEQSSAYFQQLQMLQIGDVM